MEQTKEDKTNSINLLERLDLNEKDETSLREMIDWWNHRQPKLADDRPKRNNIRFTFHVDIDLLNRLREEAKSTGLPQSELLNRILESNLPEREA